MTLRQLNIIPLLILLAFIPLSKYYPNVEGWVFGLVILFQLLILIYGSMNISSGYFLPALCKAKTDEKVVALTFDDGPHPVYTPQILEALRTSNAPATFFIIGKNIAGNEEILRQITTDGHLVGNHSYSHAFWFDMYGPKRMLADMRQMDDAVVQAVGLKPLMFRPPYGVTNPMLAKAVRKGRYIPIGWSVRSFDTAIKDKQKLLFKITNDLKAGDIILLHDSMEITANMLPELIETIRGKGFRIAPLDEMLNIRAYA